ncbi:BON domain-containing protein [Phenylobacterium sp.]|jgi:hypothetical protein|uniref:BON domain-containing protein n=1 Tax=Phenylobacterium sp. TaxID=1871053 RepID=UPI002F3EEC77
MAGNNWMDDRERQIRERDGRGDDRYPDFRAQDYRSRNERSPYDEDRTWDVEDERPDMHAARRSGRDRDRVFGERDTGAGYNRGWQSPGYRGVSPAMQRGDYRRASQPMRGYGRESDSDGAYFYGGRYYGDDGRERVYGEEYGAVSYDEAYSPTRARYHAQGYGQPGYGDGYASGYTDYRRDFDRPASGGTGGYDYERGYGDGGRGDARRATYGGRDTGERMEDAGHKAGAFLRRTGRRVADWFNAGGEGALYDDLSATPPIRGDVHRGRGPQGYKRADERISEDAHERLTEDSWLDASNVAVSVSGGEVTLSGTVEHREAKHRAERIVEDISGVAHVQNNLRVEKGNYFTSPGSGYGDSVLGAQIRDAEAEGAAPSATNGGKKN